MTRMLMVVAMLALIFSARQRMLTEAVLLYAWRVSAQLYGTWRKSADYINDASLLQNYLVACHPL